MYKWLKYRVAAFLLRTSNKVTNSFLTNQKALFEGVALAKCFYYLFMLKDRFIYLFDEDLHTTLPIYPSIRITQEIFHKFLFIKICFLSS